ncbi:hypothetical protein ABWI00_17930 [Algihabitans albus]|uniref:hypothetical protein n=1 Tax=Algihabitans albus TaxID=2164067 RepID=UPI0035D03D3E
MTGEQEFEIGGRAARDLWGRVAQVPVAQVPVAQTADPAERPEPALLAAWLDGSLGEAEAAPIEAWLAQAPGAVEDVVLLRDAVGSDERTPAAPPSAFIERAQAIVRAPAKVKVERDSWLGALWGAPLVRWGGVAALAVVIGFGGFQMGNEGLAPSLATLQTSQVTMADFGAQPTPFL